MLASVRAGNVVGGGDWAEDRIVPDAVRAVTSGRSLEIRSPNAVRPWQHVLEPLSGYMLLAAKMMNGKPNLAGGWNFGPAPSEAFTVAEMMHLFYSLWGEGNTVCDGNTNHLHEAAYLTLSSEKAMKNLAWHPVWSFAQTIERTAKWYKGFYENRDALRLSLADIDEYMKNLEY